MFYFCKKPQYKDAFEATANFLQKNNVAFRTKTQDFQMLSDRGTKIFEVVENTTPLGALSSKSVEYVPKFSIIISGVDVNPRLARSTEFGFIKTNFNYKIEKFGENSFFQGPQWSDNESHFTTRFEIYNEYARQLDQLFEDIKHALNPEFWVNPDKVLELEGALTCSI